MEGGKRRSSLAVLERKDSRMALNLCFSPSLQSLAWRATKARYSASVTSLSVLRRADRSNGLIAWTKTSRDASRRAPVAADANSTFVPARISTTASIATAVRAGPRSTIARTRQNIRYLLPRRELLPDSHSGCLPSSSSSANLCAAPVVFDLLQPPLEEAALGLVGDEGEGAAVG